MPYSPRISLPAIVLAVFASLPAAATDFPSFPFLTVEGKATAEVPPDKATLSIRVSAFDRESAIATETVQQQLIALLQTLANYSVPDDAITSFSLAKNVERARKDRVDMEIVGYYVSRRVEIEISDLSQFAELVADLAKLDNVASLDADFDVTDRDAIEARLINEAGADARRIAENMVHGMSREVGPVFAVSQSSLRTSVATFSLGVQADYPRAIMRYEAGYHETVFEPSTIELRQSVHVIFELE